MYMYTIKILKHAAYFDKYEQDLFHMDGSVLYKREQLHYITLPYLLFIINTFYVDTSLCLSPSSPPPTPDPHSHFLVPSIDH